MLKNMRDTSVVGRIRLEADGEDIVAVIASNMEVVGAGLVVLQMDGRKLQLRYMLGSHKSKAVKLFARFGELRQLRDGFARRGSCVSEHIEVGRLLSGERSRVEEGKEKDLVVH